MNINRDILLQIARNDEGSDWKQIIAVDISGDIIFYKGLVCSSNFKGKVERNGFTIFEIYNEYLIKFKMNLL